MFNIDDEIDEFKIGDRVECIDTRKTLMGGFWCSLILGKIYTIEKIDGDCISLLETFHGLWVKKRFKHVRNR